ncbi:MAG: hypothetical protein IH851_11895 [Armatimonadetes bacterium]|nr:hypothetical protein [Armatimonadota bacterium]
MQSQTSFETARGISGVDVEEGYALVEVRGIPDADVAERRLSALRTLNEARISIDFLKVNEGGFSFVVPEEAGGNTRDALLGAGFDASLMAGRAILSVRAPNVRDESGLLARICEHVVQTGAVIEQVGDMHTGVLLVMEAASAKRAAAALEPLVGKEEFVRCASK